MRPLPWGLQRGVRLRLPGRAAEPSPFSGHFWEQAREKHCQDSAGCDPRGSPSGEPKVLSTAHYRTSAVFPPLEELNEPIQETAVPRRRNSESRSCRQAKQKGRYGASQHVLPCRSGVE